MRSYDDVKIVEDYYDYCEHKAMMQKFWRKFDDFNVCMHQGDVIHLHQQHPVEFQVSQLK